MYRECLLTIDDGVFISSDALWPCICMTGGIPQGHYEHSRLPGGISRCVREAILALNIKEMRSALIINQKLIVKCRRPLHRRPRGVLSRRAGVASDASVYAFEEGISRKFSSPINVKAVAHAHRNHHQSMSRQ